MGAIDKALIEEGLERSSQIFQAELSLLARHNVYFETRVADRPSLTRAAHELRYQVYCLERKFENADEHASGLEIDQFDEHAIQGVLFHRPTDRAIGTVRIIPPSDRAGERFPIEQMLRANNVELSEFVSIADSVEVSRFAISKEFRRRWTDDCAIAAGQSLSRLDMARQANLACLSLIQFLVRQSVERRVFYWTAMMEATFLRMLARMGIHFTAIGPVVFHHGFRQPCYCHLPAMLERLRIEQRDYWEVITNGGELSQRLAVFTPAPRAARSRV